MKLSKSILAFLILLVSVLLCAAQEKPKAVLTDKFSGGARKEGDRWIKSLATYQIARDRIRIFPSKETSYPYEEFWLVPSKKK